MKPGKPEGPLSTRGQILHQIFDDMMELKDPLSIPSAQWSGPDAESRERAWRERIRRRVDELRRKLLGAKIGSYQILEEIAAGGMGIVFKARQESPMFTREIALKFMLAEPDAREDDRTRFIAEVKGLASLSHPSLVHILDSGIEQDLYYFSMELVDGWSLDDAERVVSLSLERKVEVVRDIARALAYLHARGVIHRDVKPGNIMIDREGSTKLLDFGIAQFTSDPHERAVQAGTPYFMAPEVIDPRGGFGPIGPGTDIYAIGAVLYQLLFGRPVFESEGGLGEVLARTLSAPPQFPGSRSERLPADLQAVISRTLRKKVAERYADAAKLADDLDMFLRRTRHRTPVWVGASLFAAALAAVILSVSDRPPASPLPAERRDLGVWEERLREVESIDAAAAAPLRELLEKARGSNEAAAAATFLGDLALARRAFWADRVGSALAEALELKRRYLDVPAKEDARMSELFKSSNGKLEDARSRSADETAHKLLLEAREGFEQCRTLAEAQRIEARRAVERDEARAARDRSESSRLENSTALESASQKLEGEAAKAWEAASKRMEEGERLLEGDPARARIRFLEAQDGFFRAGTIAKAEQDAKRTILRGELNSLRLEQDRLAPRLAKNLPPEVLLKLEQLRSASEASSGQESLTELARGIQEHREKLTETIAQVAAAEKSAAEAEARARSLVPKSRVPLVLTAQLTKARESLAEGEARLRSDDLRQAEASFERARKEFALLQSETERLTRGMVWVDGSADLPGFWIDRCEVTVGEYRSFGRHLPESWQEQVSKPGLPVVGVSLEGAKDYARWSRKELPSDAEWIAAARGKGGRAQRYPFGERFDERIVSAAGKADGFAGLAPAVSLEKGASPWGCLHLSGNAAEWTLSPTGKGSLRGGSHLTEEPELLRAEERYTPREPFESDASAQRTAGFRCVLRVLNEEPREP